MTQRNYAESDQAAVRILRAAYMLTDGPESDILYDARQYLQDRKRYEHQFASGQRWTHIPTEAAAAGIPKPTGC